jgi:phosphoenolpyruvate carboxylase
MYLRKSGISKSGVDSLSKAFIKEYQASVDFVLAVTKEKSLLWYRPWLSESIHLRSPMIHPLNLLQMIIMETNNPAMMRETVAGIANGMLTTG